MTLAAGIVLPYCAVEEEAPPLCTPGTLRCQQQHIEVCAAAGDAWEYLESCGAGETCAGGSCVPDCAPDCEGLACGGDGCGGSCGACPDGSGCVDGACVEGACECDGGPCCEDCMFLGADVACVLNGDKGCSITGCGGDVVYRTQDVFCSGYGSFCDGDAGPWSDWIVYEDCAATEVCDLDAYACVADPACEEQPPDCDAAVAETEPNDDDASASLLAPGDLNVCSLDLCVAGSIDAAGDEDWFYFQTDAAAGCPYDLDLGFTQGLEVRVVVRCWGVSDKIYWTLPDPAGIACEKLTPGAGPMGPDQPGPAGEAVSCVLSQPGVIADLGCGDEDIGYTPGPASKTLLQVTRNQESEVTSYTVEFN